LHPDMNRSIYLERYSYGHELMNKPPDPDLEMVVVIPCYFEPDLISTLQSLTNCAPIAGKVEVFVIVNQSVEDTDQVKNFNKQTVEITNQWISSQCTDLSFNIFHQELPEKHAGVGLARKIGMDEAIRRFRYLKKDGLIICLDADCICSANYLKALRDHFEVNRNTPGCSIYFEHPLSGPLPPHIYRAIAAYELHLRYYTHGLKYSRLPCAFQTVGSSMAVRSSAYEKQGGMNKRQAGEDFYFLQKIMKLGGFTELNSTAVFPSSRLSNRVPFGTGKVMIDSVNADGDPYLTYSPKTFSDLRSIASNVEALHRATHSSINKMWDGLSPCFQEYIQKEKFNKKILDLNQATRTLSSFAKRFFQWIDGFFAFKYANYAADNHYPKVDISEAAAWLLKEMYHLQPAMKDSKTLLHQFRLLDKQ